MTEQEQQAGLALSALGAGGPCSTPRTRCAVRSTRWACGARRSGLRPAHVRTVPAEEFLDDLQRFQPVTLGITATKQPSVKGSDVDWLEVAEFLHELASELASELREAA